MRLVRRLSSSEGDGFPLGWLCARITPAAPIPQAGANISRGWARLAVNVPIDIVSRLMTPCRASRKNAIRYSFFLSRISSHRAEISPTVIMGLASPSWISPRVLSWEKIARLQVEHLIFSLMIFSPRGRWLACIVSMTILDRLPYLVVFVGILCIYP